jgi:hypothetical protein
MGGLRKMYGGCLVSWHLCVFWCFCTIVVEGACVRDCRVMAVCIVS